MLEELQAIWAAKDQLGLSVFERKLIQGVIAQLTGNGRGTLSAKQYDSVQGVLLQYRDSLMDTKTLSEKEEEQSYKSKLIAVMLDKFHWGAALPVNFSQGQLYEMKLADLEELNRSFLFPPDWGTVAFRKKHTPDEAKRYAAETILGERATYEYEDGKWKRRTFGAKAKEIAEKMLAGLNAKEIFK